MLSELSGSFGLSAEVVPSTVKGEEGQQVARLSLRVGSSAAAPAKCAPPASLVPDNALTSSGCSLCRLSTLPHVCTPGRSQPTATMSVQDKVPENLLP